MIHVDFSKLFIDLQSVTRSDTEGLVLEHCSDTKSPDGNSVRSTYRVCDPKEPWRELARVTVLIPQYEVK
jgi:hypothetical protein